jgi:hypothetical protein
VAGEAKISLDTPSILHYTFGAQRLTKSVKNFFRPEPKNRLTGGRFCTIILAHVTLALVTFALARERCSRFVHVLFRFAKSLILLDFFLDDTIYHRIFRFGHDISSHRIGRDMI